MLVRKVGGRNNGATVMFGVLTAALVGLLIEFHVYHRRTVSRLVEDQEELADFWGQQDETWHPLSAGSSDDWNMLGI